LTWEGNPKDFRPVDGDFLVHLKHHSKVERVIHATDISKMLRPYLIGKEKFFSHNKWQHIFHEIRTELEEVGAIQTEVSFPHGEAVAGNVLEREHHIAGIPAW
jgi:hypothetical protein